MLFEGLWYEDTEQQKFTKKQFKETFPTTFLIGNRHSYVTVKLGLALGFVTQISLLGLMAGSKDRGVTTWPPHKTSGQQLKPNGFQEMNHWDTAVLHTSLALLNQCFYCHAQTQQWKATFHQAPPVSADFQRQHLPSSSPFLHCQDSPWLNLQTEGILPIRWLIEYFSIAFTWAATAVWLSDL